MMKKFLQEEECLESCVLHEVYRDATINLVMYSISFRIRLTNLRFHRKFG